MTSQFQIIYLVYLFYSNCLNKHKKKTFACPISLTDERRYATEKCMNIQSPVLTQMKLDSISFYKKSFEIPKLSSKNPLLGINTKHRIFFHGWKYFFSHIQTQFFFENQKMLCMEFLKDLFSSLRNFSKITNTTLNWIACWQKCTTHTCIVDISDTYT